MGLVALVDGEDRASPGGVGPDGPASRVLPDDSDRDDGLEGDAAGVGGVVGDERGDAHEDVEVMVLNNGVVVPQDELIVRARLCTVVNVDDVDLEWMWCFSLRGMGAACRSRRRSVGHVPSRRRFDGLGEGLGVIDLVGVDERQDI